MEQIVKKWDDLGFLKLTKNHHHKVQLACLLENQRIFNELAELENRLAIPVLIRVFNNFIGFDLVSVQALNAPSSKFQYRDANNILRYSEIAAHTRFLQTWLEKDRLEGDLKSQAKFIEDLAEAVLFELNSEVVADLRQVAATTISHQWKTPQNLLDSLIITAAGVSKKVGRQANWAVVPRELATELSYLKSDWQTSNVKPSDTNIYKAGTIAKRIDIYVDPMTADYGILMGYKGDDYQSGYFFCPYLPIQIEEDRYLKVRHGKKLIDNNFYAQILVENYFPTTEEQRHLPPFIEQFEPDFPGAEEFIKFGDDSAFLLDEES